MWSVEMFQLTFPKFKLQIVQDIKLNKDSKVNLFDPTGNLPIEEKKGKEGNSVFPGRVEMEK